MKRPAVFFDRDNTLIINDGYLGNPDEVVLVEGAADAIARVRALGYAAVVFSNQSGVARGKFTEEAVRAVNARMDEMLLDQNPGAVIDRHEFCPFHPEGEVEAYKVESDLRKPQPGMIFSAAEKLALDLSSSWVIGDAPRDVEAGKAAGCRTILFKDDKLVHSPAAIAEQVVTPDYVVATLAEAAAMVEIATRVEPPAIVEAAAAEAAAPAAPQTPAPTASMHLASSVEPTPAPALKVEVPVAVSPQAPVAPAPPAPSPDLPLATTSAERGSTASISLPIAPATGAVNPETPNLARIETLLQQLLEQTRRNHEQPHTDFAVSKLMAGIVQIVTLAALFLAYLRHDSPGEGITLLYALTFQALAIALLVMGRQR